jgi:hypothetical protein
VFTFKRFSVMFACAVTVLAASTSLRAEPDDAGKVFDSLYGKDIERVKATRPGADDVELAQTLFAAVDQAKEQPALMQMMLEKVVELSLTDPAGYETAAGAINRIAAIPDAPREQMLASFKRLTDLRQRQFSSSSIKEKPAVATAYMDDLIALGDLLTEGDDHKSALATYRKALALGRIAESDMRDELVPRISRAANLDRAFAQINGYKNRLKSNPDDADASRGLLLAYIVQLDRPAEARKFSFTCPDEQLKANISLAATPIDQIKTPELLTLGDWYNELAESVATLDPDRLAMYNHAREYFETYLAREDKQNLSTTKAKLALARAAQGAGEIEKQQEAAAEAASGGEKSKWTNVLEKVKLSRHVERGAWEEQKGSFACQAGSDALLRIPIRPDGSYEFKAKIQRNFGAAEVGINLPVGDRMVTFVAQGLHGQFTGISNIDGWMYYDNATRNNRGAMLPFKSSVTVFARVQVQGRSCKIYCSVGGQRKVNWTGQITQLSTYYKWDDGPMSLGFVCDYGNIIVQSAELRMLDDGKMVDTDTDRGPTYRVIRVR